MVTKKFKLKYYNNLVFIEVDDNGCVALMKRKAKQAKLRFLRLCYFFRYRVMYSFTLVAICEVIG